MNQEQPHVQFFFSTQNRTEMSLVFSSTIHRFSHHQYACMASLPASSHVSHRPWMSHVLKLAAIYNLAYGLVLAVMPQQVFDFLQMPTTPTPMIQCIGMMVGAYALGYWLASSNPLHWWPLVFVGIAGKLLGPLGFLVCAWMGTLPWRAGWMNVTNDVIWLPFFIVIVWRAYTLNPQHFKATLGIAKPMQRLKLN